jgi:hypothetical protein
MPLSLIICKVNDIRATMPGQIERDKLPTPATTVRVGHPTSKAVVE